MAALCLWAACYRTPAGALVRKTSAAFFGLKSSARPLLSYYGAGEDLFQKPAVLPATRTLPEDLPPELALGYGVFASLGSLDPTHRQLVLEEARRVGVSPQRLIDSHQGPREAAHLLELEKERLGSEDAAVLAALCGYEPARFAAERVSADGQELTLEHLGAQLPPDFELQTQLAASALALGTAYGLSWPVSETLAVSSPFGMRQHPILNEPKMHTGVDIPMPAGSPVHAAADGDVRRASEDGVNGRVLILDHGHGVSTAYCHNSELLVREGMHVHRGDLISRSGNTGRSTGPHLHFQVDLPEGPVDPLKFRRARMTVALEPGP